jgi:hypothetical protein
MALEFDTARHVVRGKLKFRESPNKVDLSRFEPIRVIWCEFYRRGGEFHIDDVVAVCKDRGLNEEDSIAYVGHVSDCFYRFGLLRKNRYGAIKIVPFKKKSGAAWVDVILNSSFK